MSHTNSAGTVLDTPDAIRFFTVLNVGRALAMEICTNMVLSSRGSALDAARIQGVIPEGRTTKKAALKATVKLLKQMNPDYVPTGTIKMGLDKK